MELTYFDNMETFTTTPESPVCKDGDEWDDLLAKPVIGKATPVKVWW
ncbi:MAG: hypothetical protein AB1478_02895 [Nitrospirota bacterium]